MSELDKPGRIRTIFLIAVILLAIGMGYDQWRESRKTCSNGQGGVCGKTASHD